MEVIAMSDKNLKVRDREEIQTRAEDTRPGPVFSPAVDIFETEENITLLADMPGVSDDSVDIDLREGRLTVTGEVQVEESDRERPLVTEYETGRYHRVFSVSDRIDQEGIGATLKDGVLRLILPKAERAKPRKIEVTTE
jgi:HSP20 family molecular chaperone IbpA